MTAITVLNKSNVPIGPFTREQVAQKLQTGEFALTDLSFVEGLTQWTPLREVLARIDGVPVGSIPPPPLVFATPAAPSAATPGYSYAATMQPPTHLIYGGFWLRFVAHFIDGLILAVPIAILFVFLGVLMGGLSMLVGNPAQASSGYNSGHGTNVILPAGFILLEFIVLIGCLILSWLYYAMLESGPHQATYGKRIMNLKVTGMAGEQVGFGHATGRFFSKFISACIPFGIGYIMAGLTERKQALHDMIAGTLVVRT